MEGIISKGIDWLLRSIRGGGGTVQEILDNQGTELDLARSPQSGSITLDGTEQTLYEETDTAGLPFQFFGGFIDFTGSAWAGGESVTLTVYVKLVSGGTYRIAYQPAAIVALPAPVAMFVPAVSTLPIPLTNVYGVKVTLEQTVAGAGYHTYYSEWFDAKRGV